jgi:hypothetical protein
MGFFNRRAIADLDDPTNVWRGHERETAETETAEVPPKRTRPHRRHPNQQPLFRTGGAK